MDSKDWAIFWSWGRGECSYSHLAKNEEEARKYYNDISTFYDKILWHDDKVQEKYGDSTMLLTCFEKAKKHSKKLFEKADLLDNIKCLKIIETAEEQTY